MTAEAGMSESTGDQVPTWMPRDDPDPAKPSATNGSAGPIASPRARRTVRERAIVAGPSSADPSPAEVAALAARYAREVPAERARLAREDPAGELLAYEPIGPWERDLLASEDRAAPLSWAEIDADPVAAALLPATMTLPRIMLERIGPSYRVIARPLGARFVFRDVRTDRDLSADVTVSLAGRHLFRTGITLSLTGRDKIARTAAELTKGDSTAWRLATFAAVEAVLQAEEQLGAPVDLRTASLALPAGGTHIVRPIWPAGSMYFVSPGDSGKSTIARALAVSLAGAIEVLPGVEPVGEPRPVLYVAGEDPVAYWHSRSVEAICRGIEIDRASLAQPIELFDARGRPLHRIARAIAERAADFGAIILDSQQALLAQLDASAGIRDRDSLFWHAVDQSERPTLIIAHPNRDDAKRWGQADGRIAGSEVNRDRARMAWRATWHDEPAVYGTSFRRYTLANTKNNHGPKEPPLGFAAAWQFGIGDDPGVLRFMPSEPVTTPTEDPADRRLTKVEQATIEAWEAGARTPAALGRALGVDPGTAKQRVRRLRERGLMAGPEAGE